MSTVGSSSSLEVSSSERWVDFFGFVGSGAEAGCYKDVNSAYPLRQGDEMGRGTRTGRGCDERRETGGNGTGQGGRDAHLERGEGAEVDWQ